MRVKFGEAPHQVVPCSVAERILWLLRERHPVQFGTLLAEVLVGPQAIKSRRNGAQSRGD